MTQEKKETSDCSMLTGRMLLIVIICVGQSDFIRCLRSSETGSYSRATAKRVELKAALAFVRLSTHTVHSLASERMAKLGNAMVMSLNN
jgi:hypothetical protein